jgi:hypothetical protein
MGIKTVSDCRSLTDEDSAGDLTGRGNPAAIYILDIPIKLVVTPLQTLVPNNNMNTMGHLYNLYHTALSFTLYQNRFTLVCVWVALRSLRFCRCENANHL